ncbi:sensor domain-containing diguanylate cyclase [Megalodesulfovibrio gigas]|uniref:diguanylate cyclase n=1 Tax=Megalodesulfovibrio gigas (strain ATCC 19364 / DSM 1382 / NCIMB 9332 / VKM B-1759) TaxID=1121448 RepID=T2GG54_MEGG1|nr:GGDEF domain-containing protein [Megalodesulfovibrio gigas]AGW15156.1 putative diguanylate cyclase with GAF sensor [Megalodesulfovibrio gigas DSM 1382 = ATCC 19364]
MTRLETSDCMWGVGLADSVARTVEQSAGERYSLRSFSCQAIPAPADYSRDNPCLIWIAWSAWEHMTLLQQQFFTRLESAPKVLLLDEDVPISHVEDLLIQGSFSTMRLPLKPEQVLDALHRAEEVAHLYADIYKMTQEIYLERELLARKNEQLSFINQFISRAAQSLEPAAVLNGACQDLKRLLPVDMLQGIFWNTEQPAPQNTLPGLEAVCFMATDKDSEPRQAWLHLLLDSATRATGQPVRSYQILPLASDGSTLAGIPPRPTPGTVMFLPAACGGIQFGCLALHTSSPVNLGRDQVELLHTAASHLSLALRNALLFDKARNEAEYDGLTMIHNRRHFDRRLREELTRHERYGHPLSLLLLDMDHFKSINDTFGHQAGDAVLMELGAMLKTTVRATDYPARYGGEEFTVILPQTDAAQAWTLAERLRTRIMGMTFNHQGERFRITASVGIATHTPGAQATPATPESLLREADEALYAAKGAGRNQVHWNMAEDHLQVAAR